MIERHLLKLRARHNIHPDEEAAIRAAITETRRAPAGAVIVPANQPLDFSVLLIAGLACRQKDLRDGRRQITELHTPGDFADLHSYTLKRLDHEVAALTECSYGVAPHENLRELIETFPRLGRIYWFATNLDAAIHREWALSLGRRTALERMSHLFCEVYVRLGLVGLRDENSYEFKLTQAQLAECLGVTPVHANRTLMQLRDSGVVEFRAGQVVVHDFAKLQAIAEFDPSYLYLDRRAP